MSFLNTNNNNINSINNYDNNDDKSKQDDKSNNSDSNINYNNKNILKRHLSEDISISGSDYESLNKKLLSIDKNYNRNIILFISNDIFFCLTLTLVSLLLMTFFNLINFVFGVIFTLLLFSESISIISQIKNIFFRFIVYLNILLNVFRIILLIILTFGNAEWLPKALFYFHDIDLDNLANTMKGFLYNIVIIIVILISYFIKLYALPLDNKNERLYIKKVFLVFNPIKNILTFFSYFFVILLISLLPNFVNLVILSK